MRFTFDISFDVCCALQLTSLPPSFVYVGRSHLSLGDIRSFNRVQQTHYELHQNDCRYDVKPRYLQ